MRDSLDDGERAETPLDQYFSTIKPSNDDDQDQDHGKERTRRRRRTHPKQLTLTEATRQARGASSSKSTIEQNRSLNKAIRQTLGKDDNPVTNSSAYGRTLHVQSCSTGHQGGGGGGGRKWSLHRNAKLAIQAADRVTRTLEGVVAYISGYTGEEHTNLELRTCVERQGGKCLTAFSTSSKVCTHVFSTTQLSGSKQQKYIESNRKNKFKIVLPRWAFECERSGKRLAEANFVAPIKHQLQSSVFEIYKSTVPHVNASTTREENDLDCQLVDDSSLSTTTSKGKGRAEEEGVLILSPSPWPLRNATSQDLDVKALEHDRDESTLSSKRRKTNGVDDQERGKQRRGRRLIEKENSIEELLIVGSSDVEPEFASVGGGPIHRRQTPRGGGGGEGRRAERGGSETEELDEFGMPPSGQRRR